MRLDGPVDLAASLQGGQAFRWTADGTGYAGVVVRRAVRFEPLPGGAVRVHGMPLDEAAAYFRLEPADAARRARLARDPVLAPAVAAHPGLRLLRQDPWETTAAFITSANNNVPRIEGTLRHLARKHGERLAPPGGVPAGEFVAFPAPEVVARLRETSLRAAGLGYRAPFLKETARMVARGEVDLPSLRGRPLAEAREALLALPGVGPKVADCIALFSLDCDDAFPIDRWIVRAVADAFLGGGEPKPRDVEAFARARWGQDAGLAQQLLFHAIRLRAGAPGTGRLREGQASKALQ